MNQNGARWNDLPFTSHRSAAQVDMLPLKLSDLKRAEPSRQGQERDFPVGTIEQRDDCLGLLHCNVARGSMSYGFQPDFRGWVFSLEYAPILRVDNDRSYDILYMLDRLRRVAASGSAIDQALHVFRTDIAQPDVVQVRPIR